MIRSNARVPKALVLMSILATSGAMRTRRSSGERPNVFLSQSTKMVGQTTIPSSQATA